jgi:hypothetical protein
MKHRLKIIIIKKLKRSAILLSLSLSLSLSHCSNRLTALSKLALMLAICS